MIQRIQSLYMLIATILMALVVFLPLGSFLGNTEEVKLTAFGFINTATQENILIPYGLTITAIASTLLSFVNIFLFKKRMLQFRLCIVEMIMTAGTILFEIYYFWGAVRAINSLISNANAWTVSLTAILPLIAFIFTYLALRGVKKDILLIKSLGRIR